MISPGSTAFRRLFVTVGRWEAVGDWIWAQLLRGDDPAEIKRMLCQHVDEIEISQRESGGGPERAGLA